MYFSCYLLHHRDELFRQSLAKLREQIVKANTLVREANFLAEEMSKLTDYQVTLQIPAENLSANKKVMTTQSPGKCNFMAALRYADVCNSHLTWGHHMLLLLDYA